MKKVIMLIPATVLAITGFAQSSKKSEVSPYGKNIVRLHPINVFVNGGVGFGLSYERILSDDGKFGLKIPFHFGMNTDYSGWGSSANITNYSLMINPGIKFYPMGQRKVTYGLGFSLFGITGDNNHYVYNSNNNSYRLVNGSHSNFGMMVDNSIQFNLTPKFNIGLELGLGPSYFNRYNDGSTSYNDPIEMMASFNFHMGYRF